MTDALPLPPTPCRACPLNSLPVFARQAAEQIEFIQGFKTAEVAARAGAAIYLEGADSPHLYTILEGWAFRYKSLPDGRRQILNYALRGDLLGLQNTLEGPMEHGVEALTPVRLCVFPRDRLVQLFGSQPALALGVTWLAMREERILDDNLLAVGRRSAQERIAYLLWQLVVRAREAGLAVEGGLELPMRQQHLADTLGMSLVSFNKTLQRLRASGCVAFVGRKLVVENEAMLREIGKVDGTRPERRPYL